MQLRVEFADVDMHQHVHNQVFLRYAETAVNELLWTNGLSAHFDPASTGLAYHVRKVEVVYHASAGFRDLLDVTPRLARVGRSSLTFAVETTHAETGAPVAGTEIVWVCVDVAAGVAAPVPDVTRHALAAVTGSGP